MGKKTHKAWRERAVNLVNHGTAGAVEQDTQEINYKE